MSQSRFEAFLMRLAHVLALQALAPDIYGACMLMIREGEIPLLFEFDEQLVPNTVLLSCAVCPLIPENKAAVLEETLKANELGEETLSLKPDEDMLYLHRRLHPETPEAELHSIIGHFLELVRTWRQKTPQIPPRNRHPSSPRGVEIPPYRA